MTLISISEVAKSAELRPSALRYYEHQGLIHPAGRHGGKRVYETQVLQRLGFIRLAQSAGFSIAEIGTLLNEFSRRIPPGKRWQKLAESKRQELDEKVRTAQAMRKVLDRLVGCECATIDDCGIRIAESSRGKDRCSA